MNWLSGWFRDQFGSPVSSDTNAWTAAIYMVVVVIVLLGPALALVYVGLGKWGFISGLVCGGVLSYLFLPLAGVLDAAQAGVVLFASVAVMAAAVIQQMRSG